MIINVGGGLEPLGPIGVYAYGGRLSLLSARPVELVDHTYGTYGWRHIVYYTFVDRND